MHYTWNQVSLKLTPDDHHLPSSQIYLYQIKGLYIQSRIYSKRYLKHLLVNFQYKDLNATII